MIALSASQMIGEMTSEGSETVTSARAIPAKIKAQKVDNGNIARSVVRIEVEFVPWATTLGFWLSGAPS